MPVPTEEHAKLHFWEGRWIGEEDFMPSPWGPGGPALGKTTCRVECDGFFLSQDYVQEKGGQVTFRGHGIIGWDAQRRQYVWYWVDSMGIAPAQPSYGAWEGSRLLFHSQSPQGASRFTYEPQGLDRYRFSIESSPDGGKSWNALMTAQYRRA